MIKLARSADLRLPKLIQNISSKYFSAMEGGESEPPLGNAPAKTEKKKEKRILFYASFFVEASSPGVHLAEDREDFNEEQYFEALDEYDSPDYDDLCYANSKRGCSFCRPVAKNRRMHNVSPRRRVNFASQRRAARTAGNLLASRQAQKENVNTGLEKRGIQRRGTTMYAKRADLDNSVPNQQSKKQRCRTRTPCPSKAKSQDHPAALKYELRSDNIPKEAGSFMNQMVDLQHRELRPEDYELLLQLDESVAPKTISRKLLDSIVIVTVDAADILGELCTICMEQYHTAQKVKTLTCKHTFHADCIDHWFSTASQNCPLDGLVLCL